MTPLTAFVQWFAVAGFALWCIYHGNPTLGIIGAAIAVGSARILEDNIPLHKDTDGEGVRE